jgi:GntR family transcriptional regulator/MocR family aminotransferase
MARQRILLDWISIDRGSPDPVYRQISRQIEHAVDEDWLAPGTYLPASRTLAAALGVSRLTVLSAYESLVADGFLETIAGSGTRVASGLAAPRSVDGPAGPLGSDAALGDYRRGPAASRWPFPENEPVAFRTGIPALDLFPRRVWSMLLRRHGLRGDLGILDYVHLGGHQLLREMIARYLTSSRGVRCAPSQIIVVGSARAALSLACSVLAKRGETAVWGEPGYYHARANFELWGLRLAPIPVDDNGLRVGELARRAPAARLVYVTPCHHWPTGVTLSPGRRRMLLAWARRREAWIIEDDYDSEFRFEGAPSRPLMAEPDGERVILLGTFAKTLAPSIRCGYLVVPESLAPRFHDRAITLGAAPPLHIQAALADFMNEGYFTQYIQRMRKTCQARRDTLERELADTLGNRLAVRHPVGGLQLVADLPASIPAEIVSRRAAEWKLAICPLSDYYLTRPAPNALHLGFAPVPEPEIAPAVRRLAQVIASIS